MKQATYLTILLSLLCTFSASAQEHEWSGRFGGTGEDVVRAMHVDAEGNSYTTGYFTDTADFDIGIGETNLVSNGFYDVFIQKTDSNGELVWAQRVGGSMFDYGVGITTDPLGNVYITGYFDETVDFDPGTGEALLTSQGGGDIFILKLDSEGSFVWAKSVGGADYEEATSIDVDELGNVYTIGYIYQTVDFDPGAGEYMLTSEGSSDTFLLKLDVDGNFVSAMRYGGTELDLGMDLYVKDSENIFIAGFFDGTTDLDPRPSKEYPATATEGFAGYALHLGSDGSIKNVYVTEGGEFTNRSIAVDDQNNMYVTGYFGFTVDFAPTSGSSEYTFSSPLVYNSVVVKISNNGEVAWARHLHSDDTMLGYDLKVGANGQVYSSGFFNGTADFDPSGDTSFDLSKTSSSVSDAYLSILDAKGAFVDAFQYGGVNFIDTHQMGIDSNDNVYLAAHFEATVDLNPMPDNINEVTALDFRDNYLIKMASAPLAVPSHSNKAFEFYPNPAQDKVTLRGTTPLEGHAYKIYSSLGQLLETGTISQQQSISMDGLPSGIYFVSIANQFSFKLVKQ